MNKTGMFSQRDDDAVNERFIQELAEHEVSPQQNIRHAGRGRLFKRKHRRSHQQTRRHFWLAFKKAFSAAVFDALQVNRGGHRPVHLHRLCGGRGERHDQK